MQTKEAILAYAQSEKAKAGLRATGPSPARVLK